MTADPFHAHRSPTLLYLLTVLTRKKAKDIVGKAEDIGFGAYRQLCLVYGTFRPRTWHSTACARTFTIGGGIDVDGRPDENTWNSHEDMTRLMVPNQC